MPEETRNLLSSALDRIKTLTRERDALRDGVDEPVAIVGMGARMPGGADDASAFWDLLVEGGDAVTPYPRERLKDVPGGFPEGAPTGGFLNAVDRFDAAFFGISAREAAYLDPQQRLLLEVSWEALESAGARPGSLRGSRLGVYLGVTNNDYMESLLAHTHPEDLDAYALTGMAAPFAAGRIAYWLGTHGPALAVDTACSSSLVAVHLAAQALRSRDADLALAGGVNVLLSPEWYTVLGKAGMLSPHSRCATFDASADGYVRSEGCGVVVLKRLSDAQADGDRVLAVLRGSAVNQDGRAGGITVPNAKAQREVVRSALTASGLTAEDIDYVEAHGTGTPVGDPIEMHALADVLCPQTRRTPLLVGSVKTNIGHLEPAAGVAGLIKVLLSLNHDLLPPHRGLTRVNDDIGLEELKIDVPVEARAWKRGDRVRRAGVSAFGASGTNAHLVIEEAPERTTPDRVPVSADGSPKGSGFLVLPLSARTAEGVADLAGRYLARLGGVDGAVPDGTAADLAYTAGVARDHWSHRCAVAARTVPALRSELLRVADGEVTPVVPATRRGRRTAFLFTGQGSQYAGMGTGLLKTSPAFRAAMQHCAGLVDHLMGRPLLEVLSSTDDTVVNDTRYTQPALVALQWSLAQTWQSLGVSPDVVVGHSVGEISAATVAGVLDIGDALAVAVARGRLMQELTENGAMAAVFAPASVVDDLLLAEDDEGVGPAAFNGPEHVVISGRPGPVHRVLERAAERGLRGKALKSQRAFHSPLMRPMLDAFAGELSTITFHAPSIRLVSALTAETVAPHTWNAEYLLEHALRPVDFAGAMNEVLSAGAEDFLELGPGATLLAAARRLVPEQQRSGLWAPSLRPGREDIEAFSGAVADAYTSGRDIDWGSLWEGTDAAVADAPTYPFRRTRHWYEPSRREAVAAHHQATPVLSQDAGDLLGRRVPTAGPGAAFLSTLDSAQDPALADCAIGGEPIVNVGFFLEAALQAAHRSATADGLRLDDVSVLQRLRYDAQRPPTVMLVTEPTRRGGQTFSYRSDPDDPALVWPEHCRGRVVVNDPPSHSPPKLPEQLPQRMSGSEFYRRMWSRKLFLGDGAKWVEDVSFDSDHARARLRAQGVEESGRYIVPPGLTDAMFQVLFACLTARGVSDSAYMVVALESFAVRPGLPAGPTEVRLRLRSGAADGHTLTADVFLCDASGTVFVSANGVTLARAQADAESPRPRRELWGPVEVPTPAELPTEVGTVADPLETVVGACARSLRAEPTTLPRDEPVQDLGLDSLMALEIKDAVMERCGVAVPLALFLDGATVGEIATYVAERLPAATGHPPEPVSGDAGTGSEAGAPADVVLAAPSAETRGTKLVVDRGGRNEPFELTDLQQAYLVGRSEGMELGGVSTFFFIEVDLKGLDCERFEAAVDAAVHRHDMLRAVMTEDGRQRVLPGVAPYHLDRLDLTQEPESGLAARLAERSSRLSAQVFDPRRWPLFHLAVTFLPEGTTRLHVGVDALIIDAWSTALLFAELAEEYRGAELRRPELTFRDYVRHVRAQEAEPPYAEARAYWMDRLDTLPPAPELPLSADPAVIGAPKFAHLSATVAPERWERFKEHAHRAGITPSTAIATAYAETIGRWSANPHFTLTLLFFNRSPVHPDVSSVLGNFSATTLLEVDTRGDADFTTRGRRLQRQLWNDLEHSAFSGVQVLRELATLHGSARAGRAPVVFASTLNFSSGEGPASTALTDHLVALTGQGREVSSSIRTPQVWLDHQVIEDAEGLRLNWDYVSQLFPEAMVASMFHAYQGLIDTLCDDESAWTREPENPLAPSELEPRRLANDTAAEKPAGLLHHGFEKAAAQYPDAVAVICGPEELTYAELDARSESLARRIIGVTTPGPDELVAVMLPKGIEQIVAVLAVLKAGKAYVPVAADLPAERARRTLELSEAVLTIADPAVRSAHPWLLGRRVLDVVGETVEAGKVGEAGEVSAEAEGRTAEPGEVAYVIFTSGSTGRPKGVVIEHRAALTTLKDVLRRFDIARGDVVMGLSALNFDLSVFDVFGTLAVGGTLVLPSPEELRDPQAWAETVTRHGVTVWNSVPALLQMLVDHLESTGGSVDSLRTVMLSGDWIPTDLPDRARRCAPGAVVHSLGGATEAAIWSITYPVSHVDLSWSSVPYGKPLENQAFHIFDERRRHRPTGVPGDLFIAGDGLARGYLGDPEKTAASFVETPLGRLYRTGDLGRYLPDGNIEFLGRQDGQVKIHGYRIELGEIESVLSRIDGVRGSVAAALGEAMEARTLVAGVVRDAKEESLEPLREVLRSELPAYMVPSQLVDLDALPITANGKVDRKALEQHCRAYSRASEEPLRDDTERAVAELWATLLPITPTGRDDDFFALGGNSLLGVRLMSSLRRRWGTELPLSVLFSHSTVATMAEAVREGQAERTALVPMTHDGSGPRSYWIHPVGGDVVCYRGVAAALKAPVTGLQVPDGLGDSVSLDDLADVYGDAIAADVTDQEVRVAGWSMGGVLALEVAERLAARGYEVAPVVAVDLMEHPDDGREEPSHADLLAWFARDVAHISGVPDPLADVDLDGADDPHALGTERLRSSGLLGEDTDAETIDALLARFAANARALASHRPGVYTVPAVLVRAERGASEDVTTAWTDHCTGPVTVRALDGDHYSVLQGDRLDAFASVVRSVWGTSDDRAANPPPGTMVEEGK